jgi:hypothetical protein
METNHSKLPHQHSSIELDQVRTVSKVQCGPSHGASTSATVDVHDGRPHGRWGFTPKWIPSGVAECE